MYMKSEKSIGISFRVTPRFKRLLEAAADRDQRSLTNMLEVLLEEHCRRHCITEADAVIPGKNGRASL